MIGMATTDMDISMGNIELEDEILRKAVDCDRDFSCLDGKGRHMCGVEYAVNDSVLFVKGDGAVYCNYRMYYGDGKVCKCPVRMEIYKKYHI